MSFLKDFQKIDQKFAWSFVGVLLAVISGSITIYLEFIKENKPNLNYIITANSSVLDIKEKIGNLDVLYRGNSLNQENKDLRIITFKVMNTGDSSILPNYYDPNDPIGFNVINGNIADKPSLITASNKYLKEKLIIKQHGNSVEFSNVILESNEFFEIKVLILHSIEDHPEIQSIGKIAGVNSINVTSSDHPADERSFLNITFGGGLLHTLLRTIVYGFFFIGLLIIHLVIISNIGDALDKIKRKKIVKTFKDYDSVKISESDDYFFDLFINDHKTALIIAYNKIKNPKKEVNLDSYPIFANADLKVKQAQDIVGTLIDRGFLKQDGTELVASSERLLVIDTFINYLKRKGQYRENHHFQGTVRNRKRVERKELHQNMHLHQDNQHPIQTTQALPIEAMPAKSGNTDIDDSNPK